MNRTKIKNYAPQARRDFIQAVKDRSAFYGLAAGRIEPVTVKGDVAIIAGRAFPREVADKRKALQERVERDGYEPTMEALAYTWFNRLVAIRYMELHGYLDHGYRVLSNPDPDKAMPEVMEHAEHVELPGLNRDRVVELKLDGTKEAELYRMLLVAQCNALHSAMPFLFERIGDETELVLPESLLHSDSIVRKLVSGIDEEDWQEVEIIGWLYEAYISERYEAVIGSVVASADIPAATQRFTPKWIVRYLVQNTLGRLWLATYPQSPLKAQMKYYIEPAEQTPEVQEQLRAITPTSLDPEAITFLDPACGSAHILVEAYDLFKAIYQERGYRAKDIPRLILGKNLFGLEIDDRAAQLAAFALMMKARADDRRIFDQGIQPHVRALVQTDGMDADDIAAALNVSLSKETPPPGLLFETHDDLFTRATSTATASPTVAVSDVKALIGLFEHAKTFGALIQVPPALAARLSQIEQRCREVTGQTSEIASQTAVKFLPVIEQARMLAARYDCVVANPPYMGSKYYNPRLKSFTIKSYKDLNADLYACFIQRNTMFSVPDGFVGMITIANWLFLSSYENLRKSILRHQTIETLNHNGRGVFGTDFLSCTFILRNRIIQGHRATYLRLFSKGTTVNTNEVLENHFVRRTQQHIVSNADLQRIPGSPVAYWVSEAIRSTFSTFPATGDRARKGLSTGNNDKYIRRWWEVSWSRISWAGGATWFPVTKGGEFRRWYGNVLDVLNYEDDGRLMRQDFEAGIIPGYSMKAKDCFFKPGVTWSDVSMAAFGARLVPSGCIPMDTGPLVPSDDPLLLLAALNSKPVWELLRISSSGTHFSVGHIAQVPIANNVSDLEAAKGLVSLARQDWDSFEVSPDFQTLPVLGDDATRLENSQHAVESECSARLQRMKELEEENNRTFIHAYGLHAELSPEVSDDQITLYRPNRQEDIKRLISYAVACMMGRYSLDKPGLIYAHGGNVGFDPGQYGTFPADPDGIVPVMDSDWFADDATHRFVEFLGVAWPRVHLEENLKFVSESLGPSRGEQPRDTIRRYLATGFYKHHLQTYKRRPIYWMFSSGKQRAFQCLVYLHRYHEGTLSRMRTEYVIPLQGKLACRIDQLANDIQKAASTAHRRRLTQERDALLNTTLSFGVFGRIIGV